MSIAAQTLQDDFAVTTGFRLTQTEQRTTQEQKVGAIPSDHSLDHIELPTPDIPATGHFYSSLFEWRFADYSPECMAFETTGREGGFNSGRKVAWGGGPRIVLYTADLGNVEATFEVGAWKYFRYTNFWVAGAPVFAIPTAMRLPYGVNRAEDPGSGIFCRKFCTTC
jgi:predicted enzyme related to lactoylglutathione lyase